MAALINSCDNCLNVYVDDCETSIVLPDVNLADSTDYNIIVTDKFGNEYDLTGTTSAGGILTVDISSLPAGLMNKYAGFITIEIYDNTGYFTTDNQITLTYGANDYSCLVVSVTPETDETECDNLALVPRVYAFASKTCVFEGETIQLAWIAYNVDTVTIDNGIGEKPNIGFIDIEINADTTYTVTATNTAGTDNVSILIDVVIACPDATVSNSDDTYSTTVGSGDNLEIPDITILVEDQNGNDLVNTAYPAAKNFSTAIVVVTPLTVDFSADDTTPDTNQSVQFTDLTVGATVWSWSFGDGEGSTSQNPTHTYKYAGTYTVTLHADDGASGGYMVKTNYITVTLETVLQTNIQAHYKADENMLVSQWNDATANAFHLVQATGTRQFVKTAAQLNGYSCMTSDGLDDRMVNNAVGFVRNQPNTVYLIVRDKRLGNPNNDVMCDGGTSGNSLMIFQGQSAPPLAAGTKAIIAGGTAVGNIGVPRGTSEDDFHILQAVWNGASSMIQYDDFTPQTGNVGANTATGISIGAQFNGNAPGNYDYVEIIVYDAAHNSATRTTVKNYLKSKFALWS